MMDLHIKNMVCDRCIKAVDGILKEAKVTPVSVSLGMARLKEGPTAAQSLFIRKRLNEEGFELLDDQKAKLVNEIKNFIVRQVQQPPDEKPSKRFSDQLAGEMHKDYHYLSSLFSSIENTTIEQYYILQKIEKVKEWLVYNEYTLSEISYKLGYSSVAHLSAQFKKVTGFTPTTFKNLKEHNRRPLDKVSP